MKKLIKGLAIATLAAAGSSAVALAGELPATGVQRSPHDMTQKFPATADALGRVCIYCHTPHNANMGSQAAGSYPLWNRDFQYVDNVAWKSYVWAAPANTTGIGSINDPLQGPTRLCLTCHDGVSAPDQHGGALSQAGGGAGISGNANIGDGNGDLTNDHPIGFSYQNALAARNANTQELAFKTDRFVTAVADSATAGTYDTLTRSGRRTIGDVLFNGDIVTCASCHDVHNKDNVIPSVNTSGIGVNYLLWADEYKSMICLSCHYK